MNWAQPGMVALAALLAAACSAGSHAATNSTDAGPDAACDSVAPPNAWPSWVMPNPAQSGLANPASYTVMTDGAQVKDDVTGLIWARNVDAALRSWADAKQFCACLTLEGVVGWRLPSRIELASIADFSRATPAIDSSAFPSTPSESFWSSSPLPGDPGLGYLVDFDSSHTSYGDMGYTYRARCVRGQGAPKTPTSGRYVVESGTVLDTQTKLTWQQQSPPDQYTWSEALDYCTALSLAGGGWRVPSISEIQTIVDDSANPSIDLVTFPGTQSDYFWSSSLVVNDLARAWTGYFANGSTYSFFTTTTRNVRCVR